MGYDNAAFLFVLSDDEVTVCETAILAIYAVGPVASHLYFL